MTKPNQSEPAKDIDVTRTAANQSELRANIHSLFGDYHTVDGGYCSSYDGKWIDMTNEVVAVADYITANYTLKSEVAERERAARVETLEDIKEWAVENSFTTSYGNAIPWWPSGLYRQVNDLIAELTKAKEQPDE